MDEVVIKKKDVDRLAKELLKEIFDFLHDEFILNKFEKMKIVQLKFLNNLVFNHVIYANKKGELSKQFLESFFNKKEFEYTSKLVDEAMKDDGIDTIGIYQTIKNIQLDMEADEDLHYKKIAFIHIYNVVDGDYKYLEY